MKTLVQVGLVTFSHYLTLQVKIRTLFCAKPLQIGGLVSKDQVSKFSSQKLCFITISLSKLRQPPLCVGVLCSGAGVEVTAYPGAAAYIPAQPGYTQCHSV